jgi:hypothetical protein
LAVEVDRQQSPAFCGGLCLWGLYWIEDRHFGVSFVFGHAFVALGVFEGAFFAVVVHDVVDEQGGQSWTPSAGRIRGFRSTTRSAIE